MGWKPGWGYTVQKGKRGDKDAIPMISRGGEHPNNGAWFHSDHLWVQNEDTANLPNVVDRRSFKKLLAFDVPEARTPEESLQCLKTREGFVVELVAAEPLVLDPVAFDWGADGKLWVAEMGDYPLGIDGKGKSGGVVRFLEDRNDDGRYDHSTVFLSELNFPNGVMAWGKGVLVSTPPDILYAEDTNGDGKADLRKVLFTGFREGNQQHRMNGFVLGLDNWIYAANGDSGGMIKSTDTGKVVNINGRDFRFKVTGEMQTLSNQTQFGLHRDDWGNWFGNNNPHWIWHVHLPMHYVVRNPHLVAKDTGKMLFNYPDSRRCFPISPQMERPNSPKSYGTVTSANSPSPYRGGLFGPDFERSVFISEPVHNLVHREVLEPDGVTFTSHRAKGEEKSEFLASSDNWFRPTMTKTGPDGALYVADMYRLVIEHPQWIPPTMQSRVNLREGSNRGRIWRIFPKGAKLRKTPRLDQMTTKELVGALDNPNGWQRDTIQRLLLTRDDKSVSSSLRKLAQASKNPKVRLQTLCILEGLDGLDSKVLKQALEDPHPSVREHAVRVCEGNHAELIASRIEDESIRVRRQVGFSLGEWKDPKAAEALVRLALADADNPRVQLAVKSSSLPHAATMLKQIFADQAKAPTSLISDLIRFAILDDNLGPLAKVFNEIAADKNLQRQFTLMAGFVDAIEQRKETLDQFHQRLTKNSKQGIKGLETVFSKVRATAQDGEAEEGSRVSAVALLGRGPTKRQEDINLLSELLAAGNRPSIRKAAL
ncbi:MAG: PVC-type heme-binding CxxCH protein, partial [Opitutales bacterium]